MISPPILSLSIGPLEMPVTFPPGQYLSLAGRILQEASSETYLTISILDEKR